MTIVTAIFTLCVLLGFLFHFIATFAVKFPASRWAWGFWLVAAILWAIGNVGLHIVR